MRYRILSIVAVIMMIMGLTASAALASPDFPLAAAAHPGTALSTVPVTAAPGTLVGPVHILTNSDNHLVGIAYPGTGSQAVVSSSPGTSYLKSLANGDWIIYNSNINCLRMRDSSNGYAVVEEKGCNTSDHSQLWVSDPSGDLNTFQNVATKQWLGVGCPAARRVMPIPAASAGRAIELFHLSDNVE